MCQVPGSGNAAGLGDDGGRKDHFQQIPQAGFRFPPNGKNKGRKFSLSLVEKPVVHKLPGGGIHFAPDDGQRVGRIADARVKVSGATKYAVASRADRLSIESIGTSGTLPTGQWVQVNANHRAASQPALQQRNAGTAHRVHHRIARLGQAINEITGQPMRESRREGVQRVQWVSLPRRRLEGQVAG